MTRLALLLGYWALVVTASGVVIEVVSRYWRPRDPVFWHTIWRSTLLSAIGGLSLGLLTPMAVFVSTGPAVWPALPVSERLAPGPIAAAIVWLAAGGSAFLLLRLVAGWLRIRRIARLAWPIPGFDDRRLTANLAMSVPVPVAFLAHHRVRSPLTIGWRQPRILLPISWQAWPIERLTIILRHELAHVARRDYAWNLFAAVAEAALWFAPGIWLVTSRLHLSAELAADDAAAAAVGRVTYAQHLVETVAGTGGGGRLAAFALAPGVATGLKRRVDALLDDSARPPAASRRVRLFVAVAVMLVVLGAMSLRAGEPGSASHLLQHAQEHFPIHGR